MVKVKIDPMAKYSFDNLTRHWIMKDPLEKEQIRQQFNIKDHINLEPIPYDPNITPMGLANAIGKYKWFAECEFNLLSYEQAPKEEWLQYALNLITEHAQFIDPIKKKPVIAFDLETTGLSTHYSINTDSDGNTIIIPDTYIVGVVLATSETKGFYIPVMHTDTERNVEYDTIREFIAQLQEKFVNVAHNATYDLAICSSNAIKLVKENNWDTLLFYKFFRPEFRSHGLKNLSTQILSRHQLEITDILKVKKGEFIAFQRLDSRNALVYAIPDALNTFALYKNLVTNPAYKDVSPFQRTNDLAYTKIAEMEAKQIYNTIFIQENGFPVHKRDLYNNLVYSTTVTTNVHQMFLDKHGIDIDKDEKTGIYVGTLILDFFKSKGMVEPEVFKFLEEKFSLVMKETILKDGTVKRTYSLGAEVLNNLITQLPTYNDEKMNDLVQDLKSLNKYRSLVKNREDLLAVWANIREDDRGCINPSALRLNGTMTKRYANSGIPLPRLRVTFTPKTKKMKITYTEKQCSINFQGFSKISTETSYLVRDYEIENNFSVAQQLKNNAEQIMSVLQELTQRI